MARKLLGRLDSNGLPFMHCVPLRNATMGSGPDLPGEAASAAHAIHSSSAS